MNTNAVALRAHFSIRFNFSKNLPNDFTPNAISSAKPMTGQHNAPGQAEQGCQLQISYHSHLGELKKECVLVCLNKSLLLMNHFRKRDTLALEGMDPAGRCHSEPLLSIGPGPHT